MGRRLRSAGGRRRRLRCQILVACAFPAAAVGIYEPAFVVAALALADDTVNGDDVVALGGESSMLLLVTKRRGGGGGGGQHRRRSTDYGCRLLRLS
jgi:hypothetical protein